MSNDDIFSNGIFTSAVSGSQGTLTLDMLREVGAKLDAQSKSVNQDWVVIDPQGRVYRGDIQRVFAILAPRHPLLKP